MEYPAASGEALLSRIRFRHLSCFVAIAQERNLRRAAERLHLSQPAVSKTLGELEALSGARLVERGRHGARLTAAGERFLRYAVSATQALDAAAAALGGTGEPAPSVVEIGALPTVASGLLHALRPHACARAPMPTCWRHSRPASWIWWSGAWPSQP